VWSIAGKEQAPEGIQHAGAQLRENITGHSTSFLLWKFCCVICASEVPNEK